MFSFALRLHKKSVSSHLLAHLHFSFLFSLDNGIMMTLKWQVDWNLLVRVLHQIFALLVSGSCIIMPYLLIISINSSSLVLSGSPMIKDLMRSATTMQQYSHCSTIDFFHVTAINDCIELRSGNGQKVMSAYFKKMSTVTTLWYYCQPMMLDCVYSMQTYRMIL